VIDTSALPLKKYCDAPKFRAVIWQHFSPTARAQAEREENARKGMTKEDLDIFFPLPEVEPGAPDLIKMSVEWTFSPKRTIAPGRFHSPKFAALYTAKEPQTAQEELLYWSSVGHEFVIYTISFTGEAIDLRPAIDDGSLILPISHGDCQPIGAVVRKSCDGLAAYSFRYKGGSCCAIFSRESVRPGSIFHRGLL
jgi:RES domain